MTSRQRPFAQMDVFTAVPYLGNPLAVVLDGSGLSDEDMQGFARWNNLSETTYLLPPTEASADYRVRIFTPGGELPFAGHPTLGSCQAWLEAGGIPKQDEIIQQCAKGLVRIRRDGTRLAFAAPSLQRSDIAAPKLAQIAQALGVAAPQIVAAQLLDNGPQWHGLLLDTIDTVLNLQPDHRALKALGAKVGVAAIESDGAAPGLIVRSNREARAFAARAKQEAVLEVRAFAEAIGITEDPVTGSLNASLAQWLIADGHLPASYEAHQGTCLARRGRLALRQDEEQQVWVGGDVVCCIRGEVLL